MEPLVSILVALLSSGLLAGILAKLLRQMVKIDVRFKNFEVIVRALEKQNKETDVADDKGAKR